MTIFINFSRPAVVSSITVDGGKLFLGLNDITQMERCNFVSAIRVACMVLKHCVGGGDITKRIIIFIASPMENLYEIEVM